MRTKAIILRNINEVLSLFLLLIFMILLPSFICAEEIPIIKYAGQGNLEEVKKLIAKGENVNSKTKEGITALMWASKNGHIEIVKVLIDHKADVNAKEEHGITALMLASEAGHTEIVKILIANKANVNAKMDKLGLTPLMFACGKGRIEIAEILINNKADVNARTPEGNTALFAAVESGKPRMVKLLLEHGADPTAKTKDGNTPLTIAESGGSPEIVRLLKEGRTKITPEISKLKKPSMNEISAEVVFRKGREKGLGRFYVKGEKYRMETAGEPEFLIVRRDRNLVWIINPNEKSYLEIRYDQMEGDPWLALWDIEKAEVTRKPLGSEKVGEHKAQKYEIIIKKGKKTERAHEWIATDSQQIIKQGAVDGSWSIEFKNIKESVSDDLFEIPLGFKRVSIFKKPGTGESKK